MNGLSIDQSNRWVDTRPCPTCPQPDSIVTTIVRKDGRALIGYNLRFHTGPAEVFVDIQFIEHEELGDFDGPDGYCAVFSCWIGVREKRFSSTLPRSRGSTPDGATTCPARKL